MILILIWLPLNYREMQGRRKEQLAIGDQNRQYMGYVNQLLADAPATDAFVFDGSPAGLHPWGVRAAVTYAARPRRGIEQAEVRTKEALELAKRPNLAYLLWIPGRERFYTVWRTKDTPDIPYIAMNERTPLWQLGAGWHGLEIDFQWTNLVADARIARPADATRFEILVNVGPQLIQALKKVKMQVLIDGGTVGEQEFTTPGWRTVGFDVAPSGSSTSAQVEFRSSPGFFYGDGNADEALGIAIGGFGFPTDEYPAAVPPIARPPAATERSGKPPQM